ncbi:ferredoxin--NADP reductase [Pedobacter sp. SYSU D00535]|uniref:ferredoxin--NADP reductase n=1 Tax=Pedobacter sp. SYSU D00535 TaxID=2810308 RepID=UPI001A96B114|nr:ferredoxin--NADP reductase [Pedobacter sp. SYSU D00535]
MITYTLKVVEIRRETSDTITISFKQPGLKKVKYKAGQYLSLIFRINGRKHVRPYSFSSAPGVDSLLEVTVKLIPGGIVSTYLHTSVVVGDVIEVIEPLGDFVVPQNLNIKHLMLWGAGSGITPLYSILKSVLHSHPLIHVTLAYCNKTKADTIFYTSLNSLEKEYSERFTWYQFLTRETLGDCSHRIQNCRISGESVKGIVQRIKHLESSIHYICGPVELKQTVKSGLVESGVAPHQIHSEDFEHVVNEEELGDITDRLVRVNLAQEEKEFKVQRGKSILEAALDADLEIPYSCQTGSCGQCKGILKTGSIRTIGQEHPADRLAEGEHLLCCSYPLSDDIEILV